MFNNYLSYQLSYKEWKLEISEQLAGQFQKHAEQLERQNHELVELKYRIEHKLTTIESQNNELKEQNDTLIFQVDDLQAEVSDLNANIEIFTEERAPRTEDTTKRNRLIIIKMISSENGWEFYVIRAQNTTASRKLRLYQNSHPDSIIFVDYEYSANSINLFLLIKEELARGRTKKIITNGNYIKLMDGYIEEEFQRDIERIEQSKQYA